MGDENNVFEKIVKTVYESMDFVCFNSLMIGHMHYSFVKDGEVTIEKRMECCEKYIIDAHKIHSDVIRYVKMIPEFQKQQDASLIKLAGKALVAKLRQYADLVKLQQDGVKDSFKYDAVIKFLLYPYHANLSGQYNYVSVDAEIEKMKNSLENIELKNLKLNLPSGGIRITGLPDMTYEEKNRRAIQTLKQFGVKF